MIGAVVSTALLYSGRKAMYKNRTIAAVSTPVGVGGISVIRMSGEDAAVIANRVFKGADLTAVPSHTVHYGHITDKDGRVIDEVLVTVMLAPKTFTRENVVEIGCHGGSAVTAAVLRAVISAGAYPAEPGEFTKRAFMNGRMDLSQAEAVIDMINAKNELARRNAVSQLGGRLSEKIKAVRDALINLSARMQVLIDYPDEELEDITTADIEAECRACREKIEKLLKSADSGRLLREGIRTVIAGKPNVGKSSLLNYLMDEDRAIVTDIAGTTRDALEESISIRGIPLLLVDTAGIRDTEDTVERIGVERSKRYLDTADLVLVVLDASAPPDENDMEVLKASEEKKRIILFNKTDISDTGKYYGAMPELEGAIGISAKTGEGIDELADEIERLCGIDELDTDNGAVITNLRHKAALAAARNALLEAENAAAAGMPSDIVSIDISAAADSLGEITGETVSESVVSEIFANFCVGK